VRSLLRRGQAVASAFSRSRRLRRHAVTTALLASVLALAFTVAAEASGYSQPVAGDTSETITSPSTTTTPTDGTDLPTSSSAYNSAWQSAPAGYITPSNDGLGTTPGQIKHVWEIVLENHAFSSNFTPLEGTENSYAASLPSQGALLTNYYGTGHSSLDNYISLASGQAPMSDDQDDCPSYNEADGSVDETGTLASNSDFGQFESNAGPDAPPYDNGCVYPSSVPTLFNQLQQAGVSWKVYAQDLGGGVSTAGDGSSALGAPNAGQDAGGLAASYNASYCGAPETSPAAAPDPDGTYASPDPSAAAHDPGAYSLNLSGGYTGGDQYVAKHNPLPWFNAVSGSGNASTYCTSAHLAPVFGPEDALYSDLYTNAGTNGANTPGFNLIIPNNCSNGHDAVCVGNNLSGMSAYPTDTTASTVPASVNDTGGTYAQSAFLAIVIPEIEASAAFQHGGLIAITYDEAYPPFTYSSDSQANSQLEKADAAGSLQNDAAGETLYGRSLNWEPTGPNATVVTSPEGQVLTAGPGDSAYLDRPTTTNGDLVACTEPTGAGQTPPTGTTGTVTWDAFTTPTGTNGACIPGFQANGYYPATKAFTGVTITAGSGVVNSTSINPEIAGESVTFSGTAPTLLEPNSSTYAGTVFAGDVANSPNQGTSSKAYNGSFQLVDNEGNPLTVQASYTGTVTTSATSTDGSTDPFYDAFDATLGGGDSGAVLISPYITPGTVSNTYYNHYSLLRSLEDIFQLPSQAQSDGCAGDSYWNATVSSGGTDVCGLDGTGYIGFAAQPGLTPFGPDVFTNDLASITNTVTQTNTVSGPTTTVTQTVPGQTQTQTQTVTHTTTVKDVYAVVPDVVGDSLGTAESEIKVSGLKVGKVTTKKSKGKAVVTATSPRAGDKVKADTSVNITVS